MFIRKRFEKLNTTDRSDDKKNNFIAINRCHDKFI